MASVEVTITGMLYDRIARTTQNVVLIGEANLTNLGVGGGPMPPGGGQPPYPAHPIAPGGPPPGIWPTPPGGNYPDQGLPGAQPKPEHPIVIPVPPGTPNVPPPGSPPVMVEGTQPVNPMTPPDAVVMEYPGVGKVVVPKPTGSIPAPPQVNPQQ